MAVAGDSVSFFLNISRTDETAPVYSISLLATILHPSEDVWNTTFDPLESLSVTPSPNGTLTVLNLTRLSYTIESAVDPLDSSVITIDRSQLSLEFQGVLGAVAYTVGFIQLHGSIEFQSTPTNGYVYVEPITFPRVFIRNAEFTFDLLSTSSEMTEGDFVVLRETAIWQASISFITGPLANLSLLVELNDTFLSITDVDIIQIG